MAAIQELASAEIGNLSCGTISLWRGFKMGTPRTPILQRPEEILYDFGALQRFSSYSPVTGERYGPAKSVIGTF
jgi:hypothetical protein